MKKQDQSGHIIVVLLFALLLSLITVNAFFFYGQNPSWRLLSFSQSSSASVLAVQSNLMAALTDPYSWRNTYTDNRNGDLARCLKDATFHCPQGIRQLVILDHTPTKSVYYDSQTSSSGFTSWGDFCSTFGALSSGGCVYRFDVTWEPSCAMWPLVTVAGVQGCRVPRIIFKFAFRGNGVNSIAKNPQFFYQEYGVE